jgi:hypothetical protein
MTKHVDNIWNEGKFLPLFTDHRRCWKRYPSTRKYLSQLIVSLKNTQQSFLHLQHTRHQLSRDGCSSCVVALALDFDTAISWARRFSDFLGVCSSLAPMSSNFSSVTTRRLCFVFVSIKSPVVLSLFTKLWIVCWVLFHHEIYVKIFADTLQQIRISCRCHTEIRVVLKYRDTWLGTNGSWHW